MSLAYTLIETEGTDHYSIRLEHDEFQDFQFHFTKIRFSEPTTNLVSLDSTPRMTYDYVVESNPHNIAEDAELERYMGLVLLDVISEGVSE